MRIVLEEPRETDNGAATGVNQTYRRGANALIPGSIGIVIEELRAGNHKVTILGVELRDGKADDFLQAAIALLESGNLNQLETTDAISLVCELSGQSFVRISREQGSRILT